MASPVTLCRRSYYHKPSLGLRPADACNNPVAPCSVRDVEHEPHDWLWLAHFDDPPPLMPTSWRHCFGVSSLETRAAG